MIMKTVEVYCARGEAEAQMIKSLLESHSIPSLIKSNAAPSAHVFTADGMGQFRIMVEESRVDEAKRVLGGNSV